MEFLNGYKTHILAIAAAIITAWTGVADGSFDSAEAIKTIEFLLVSTFRSAVAKAGLGK